MNSKWFCAGVGIWVCALSACESAHSPQPAPSAPSEQPAEAPPAPAAPPEVVRGVNVELVDLVAHPTFSKSGHLNASEKIRLRVRTAPGGGYLFEARMHADSYPRLLSTQHLLADGNTPAGGYTSHNCLLEGCASRQVICAPADQPFLDVIADGELDYQITITPTACAAPNSAATAH